MELLLAYVLNDNLTAYKYYKNRGFLPRNMRIDGMALKEIAQLAASEAILNYITGKSDEKNVDSFDFGF